MIEIFSEKRAWKACFLAASACAFLLPALAGCERKKPEPRELVVPSVEWYETHDAERAEKLAECSARPKSIDAMPDCVNASRAENSVQPNTRWQEETDPEEIRTTPLLSR